MFFQIFLSPQVERWAIITYKHGIYESLHELPNDLRLKDLRKLGNIRKLPKLHRIIAQCSAPAKNESFVNTSRKPSKTEIKLFPLCAISHEN